jgi:hypothetical protein
MVGMPILRESPDDSMVKSPKSSGKRKRESKTGMPLNEFDGD